MSKCIDCGNQTPDDGYQEICSVCYDRLPEENNRLKQDLVNMKLDSIKPEGETDEK